MKTLPIVALTVSSLLVCFPESIHGVGINEKYANYIRGEDVIDKDVMMAMWTSFRQEFGDASPASKLLNDQERFSNFETRLDSVMNHNKQPYVTYQKGINGFSDMTHEQLRDYFHLDTYVTSDQRCSATSTKGKEGGGIRGNIGNIQVPPSWDWRDYGGVSPVKNQGGCGSCWTFSTVGCLEAHALIRYGTTGNYSEQQLVDCAQAYDNHGCNGGLPSHAFEYIEAAGGISTEQSYPYDASDHTCSVKANSFALTVAGGSVNITKGDEEELKLAIYKHGPVSVAFQVVDGFGDYANGVYTSDTCKNSTQDVNHAVLAVGYGTDEDTGVDFWTVKNSWGSEWGDEGYFKIQRGVNMCGIAMCNSFPARVIKIENENSNQEVSTNEPQLVVKDDAADEAAVA